MSEVVSRAKSAALPLAIMFAFALMMVFALDAGSAFAQVPTPDVEDYSSVITAGAGQAGTQFGTYLAVIVGLALGPWALIKGLNWVRGLV